MLLHVNRVTPNLSVVNVEANGRCEGTYVLDTASRMTPVAFAQWVAEQGGVRPIPPQGGHDAERV